MNAYAPMRAAADARSSELSTRLKSLRAAVRLLDQVPVDLDDEEECNAYFAHARMLMEALIATPARSLIDVKAKAEAVAWCTGSRDDFGLGQTWSERVITSLLVDLLTEERESLGRSSSSAAA